MKCVDRLDEVRVEERVGGCWDRAVLGYGLTDD